MITHSFREQFDRADGFDIGKLSNVLERSFGPISHVTRTSENEDKLGYDYRVELQSTQTQTVDLKLRSLDPLNAYKRDDLVLETVANSRTNKPGWAVDPSKQTDWILWYWLPTGRWHLASYPLLRSAVLANMSDWRERFGERTQGTKSENGNEYQSKALFVPRWLVAQKMFELQNH